MDGIHDLGGRQGFGKVETDESEKELFHSDWEARTYAMLRAMTRAPDWSIDWFRYCRELIGPVDYLTRPYYDQWLQTYAAMLVNSGWASVEEIASGKSARPVSGLPEPMTGAVVHAKLKSYALNTERETGAAPSFQAGDTVLVRSTAPATHTRLPSYLRGRRGVVHAYRGNHVLPDANALGDERAEPLYTVGFDAGTLWPEAKGRRERIFADMWESYLEPA